MLHSVSARPARFAFAVAHPVDRIVRRALLAFAVALAIGLAPWIASYAFLTRIGELTAPDAAARRQREATADSLYGPAATYRPYAYKLEGYRLSRPDLLILGSSRAMQFGDAVLTVPAFNAGGAANSLQQAERFIAAALAIHKPKAILLTLDFWWFNPARAGDDAIAQEDAGIELDLDLLSAPLRWLIAGDVSVGDFARSLWPFSDRRGIGAFAHFDHRGWTAFGSYDYGTMLEGAEPVEDRRFARTLKWLDQPAVDSRFYLKAEPDAREMARLAAMVAALDRQGIEVVLLIPPVAPTVAQAMARANGERLLSHWRRWLATLPAPVFDFHDPAGLGSGPCEFIDGFHGGEVTYLRILRAIAGSGAGTITTAIDRAAAASLIAANAGHARIRNERRAGWPPEADFLDLGCRK